MAATTESSDPLGARRSRTPCGQLGLSHVGARDCARTMHIRPRWPPRLTGSGTRVTRCVAPTAVAEQVAHAASLDPCSRTPRTVRRCDGPSRRPIDSQFAPIIAGLTEKTVGARARVKALSLRLTPAGCT